MPSSSVRVALPLRALMLSALVVTAGSAGASSAAAQDPVPPVAPPVTTPVAPAEPTVPAGVKVGDVDLSGKTRAEATAILTGALQGQRPSDDDLVVVIAGRRHKLAMAKVDYGFDPGKTARRALAAAPGSAVKPVNVWSSEKLRAWATSLSHMGRSARNASVVIGITKQRLRGSSKGWRVTRSSVEKVANAALRDPQVPRSKLTVKVVRTSPSVTAASLMNRYGTLVTVDRPTFTLRVFKRLKPSKSYKIAVGQSGHSTPAGMYNVTSKQVNPAWHVPNSDWAGALAGKVIPGGAPNNPLVARWLGLRDGIGIHGTNEPWSVGSAASHGCLRMRPSDVIDLYPRIPMGTPVKIR